MILGKVYDLLERFWIYLVWFTLEISNFIFPLNLFSFYIC